jgi:hypothetical protein
VIADANWQFDGLINSPVTANSWESEEVFDREAIVADTGDGLRLVPRLLYAGSDTHSTVDNTDSSIGLASFIQPSTASGGGGGRRSLFH